MKLPTLLLLLVLAAQAARAEPAAEPAGRGTYPLVEASFTLRVDGNPFDFTQNDVRVDLATPDGRTLTRPAFFDGGDTWRVRHAPTQAGRYAVRRVTLNGRPADVADLQTPGFDVAGTPGHGFLRLTDAGRHFCFDDATPYYPIGYNLAWQYTGEPKMPPLVESLRKMGAARVNWTRIWMNHWDAKNLDWIEQPEGRPGEFPQPEIGRLSLGVARKWDRLLRAAGEGGVYVQVVLQHHGQYSADVNPNWQINPWNRANGGWLERPADFFTDARARELTKQKYHYILARYGAMPGVMAWELFNEVQLTDAFKSDLPAVVAWHAEMARFLRDHDSYRHLVTTSSDLDAEGLWPAMDYYQPHVYPPDVVTAIASLDARGLRRAYFYGEIGASADGDDPAEAGATVHKVLWASLMSRSAGAAQYWYWDLAEPGGALPQYAAAQKFLDAAQIRGRYDLGPLRVAADTGRRTDLTFGPGIGWGKSLTTRYVVRPDAVEGVGGMSAYLQGDANRDLFPRADFAVDFPADGTFAVRFDQLSPAGARVAVAVDGEERSVVTLDPPQGADAAGAAGPTPVRVGVELPLTAGPHEVTLRNTGRDWVRVGQISLSDYAPEVAVLAKGDAEVAVLWAYRRTPAVQEALPLTAKLTVPGRAPGRYAVTWVDTATGDQISAATATAGDNGTLTLTTPPLRPDVAAILRRLDPNHPASTRP